MITKPIDQSLDLSKLDQAIQEKRSKLIDSQVYFMREKYVDRGHNANPFYIIRCHEHVPSRYEDLRHEDLFSTKIPGVSFVHQCREDRFDQNEYWKSVSGKFVKERLDNFMKMCTENYLQPPDSKEGRYGKKVLHDKFEAKPFEFEISSPWSSLIGLCPLSDGALANFGAIEGVMKDLPPELAQLELVVKNNKGKILKRNFTKEGKFWFSKLPPGKYNLEINGFDLGLNKKTKPFGWIKGKSINDKSEHPSLRLEAPDKTIFNLPTDTGGNFHAHLPPFPYKITVPGHWFKSKIWIEGNTIISGIVKNESKAPLDGVKVLLKQKSSTLASQDTRSGGLFRFELSSSGKFALEIPGYVLFAKKVAPATIKGRLSGDQPTQIELLAKEKVLSKTTTHNDKFEFKGLIAGTYTLKSNRLKLQLDKAHQLSGIIKGVIIDKEGKPLPSAIIELKRKDTDRIITIHTDTKGSFLQTEVPEGDYTVSIKGHVFHVDQHNILSGNINGVVKDSNEVLLKDVVIELRIKNTGAVAYSTMTNDQGFFKVLNVESGEYWLKTGDHFLKADQSYELNGTIKGILKDEFSNTLIYKSFRFISSGGKAYPGKTDLQGKFQIENLPTDSYKIAIDTHQTTKIE